VSKSIWFHREANEGQNISPVPQTILAIHERVEQPGPFRNTPISIINPSSSQQMANFASRKAIIGMAQSPGDSLKLAC
jgi:hypothetical protein